MSTTKVAIVGATGATGRILVDQALAKGWEVTALVRRAESLAARPGLSIAVGNPLEQAFATEAIRGSDAVLSVIGWRRHLRGPSSTTVYSACARSVTGAVHDLGTGRFVFCSSAGVEKHDPHELWPYRHIVKPLWLEPGYADMRLAESIIRASDVPWVLVRPVRLTDGARTDRTVVSERFRPAGANFISRQDLAAFMLAQVESDAWLGKTPTIGDHSGRRGS